MTTIARPHLPARARRRPGGAPQPLPRPVYTSGHLYIALAIVLVASWGAAVANDGTVSVVDRIDRDVLDAFARLRSAVAVDVALAVDVLASDWVWRGIRWLTLAVVVVDRRWRHVVVYVALIVGTTAVATAVGDFAGRAPLAAVEVAGDVERSGHPSMPVVELGVSLVGAMYALAPRGRIRNRSKLVSAGVIGALVASRLVLGVDRPSDAAAALVLGMAVPVVLCRLLLPDAAFPVRYGYKERKTVIEPWLVPAVRESLRSAGAALRDVRPLRLQGTAGSLPLLLELDRASGGPDALFGKLYSLAQLRADRWYKLGRAILYGRLEDEAPFADIRHLVEHEDYLLRVAAAAGLPVPRSYGVFELVVGREYLLVTELLPDARQVGDAEVDEDVLRQAFEIVEGLWAAGLAHRDVKPANLVLSHGRLHLVDLSFAELHASPWRRSVDLGNMVLTMALAVGPEAAFEAASARFTRAELGEAMAATRSVTIPAQLRRMLRSSPGVLERCRALAPDAAPISVQRWSPARCLLAVAAAATIVAGVALVAYNLDAAGLL